MGPFRKEKDAMKRVLLLFISLAPLLLLAANQPESWPPRRPHAGLYGPLAGQRNTGCRIALVLPSGRYPAHRYGKPRNSHFGR